MLRVVLDANIIISGFYTAGNPRTILDLAESGAIKIAVSQPIIDEVADVLQREKFGWSKAEVQHALGKLSEVAELVASEKTVDVIKVDASDNRVLECAAEWKADYLVSGDKHLLSVGQFGRTKIVKAAEFLDVMQQRGS